LFVLHGGKSRGYSVDANKTKGDTSMEIEKVKFVRKKSTVVPTFVQGTFAAEEAAPSPTTASDIDAIVVAMGLIFCNTDNSSWLSVSDRNQTMAEAFSLLTVSLEKHDRLRFTIARDELRVNGEDVEFTGHYSKAFVSHLFAFGAINFTFAKGIDEEEFSKVMAFMCKRSDEIAAIGEFTDALTKEGFQHAFSKKVHLQEVSDEEVIVARDKFATASAQERHQIESDVVALLSADNVENGYQKAESVRKVIEDSEKMSELIMQAVATQQANPSMGPRQIAETVVECLDRAFEALLQDPSCKTQKGKKAIASALKNLEKELLSRIGGDSGDVGTVTGAVERMTEHLKIDTIVQDYSKKLKSLEESEKRILRFIKLQGLDRIKDADLQNKLTNEGLDVDGWHKLLAMSGTAGDFISNESQESHAAVAQLATMLDQLMSDAGQLNNKGLEKSRKPSEQFSKDLSIVSSHVDVLTEHAQKRINNLVDVVNADVEAVMALEQEARKRGLALRLSRKELLVVLGEVVQELCQPIAVVTCSLQMVQSKSLREVEPEQIEMLKLALESTQKMHTLVMNLGRIAGPPTTRAPDKNIQQALYDQSSVL